MSNFFARFHESNLLHVLRSAAYTHCESKGLCCTAVNACESSKIKQAHMWVPFVCMFFVCYIFYILSFV